ncbi:uncharacterized protein BXZ73DRAFT_98745 [Epithele typhae]|uniref:uncharacterized protein n=1 Tax=Epithele typhae TaxID=378194 RepID=UPI002008E70E|nr:uncharacterized protein BXZ73DRAFT_98745 [Epithele typhae]KAH9940915.1 hypothetical protein BXZ73DRAFT_98745 [Epithele typhae]
MSSISTYDEPSSSYRSAGKLALDLSNARAIENLLHEVFASIQQPADRTEFALTHTAPTIAASLEENLTILTDLEEQLPEVGTQIRDIRRVYDRGREKAQQLMTSLEWLNTPVSLRLRAIIFTPNAPVGKRWKVLVRTIFAMVLCACLWIAWITIYGAVRAHRQRLMWVSPIPRTHSPASHLISLTSLLALYASMTPFLALGTSVVFPDFDTTSSCFALPHIIPPLLPLQ